MIRNFRALANHKTNKNGFLIKPNHIFRSSALHQLTDEDISLLHNFNISKIFDLRSLNEIKERPDDVNIDVMNYNIHDSNSNQGMDRAFLENISKSGAFEFMMMLYKDYLPFSPILKQLFKDMLQQREPFLFHCAAGKDRTGIVGALLLYMLDFNMDDIISEYTIFDRELLREIENDLEDKYQFNDDMLDLLRPLNLIKPEYIKIFFQSIIENYDSIDTYIYEYLEIDQEDLNQFKTCFLVSYKEVQDE